VGNETRRRCAEAQKVNNFHQPTDLLHGREVRDDVCPGEVGEAEALFVGLTSLHPCLRHLLKSERRPQRRPMRGVREMIKA
jgi:hypothetical protein